MFRTLAARNQDSPQRAPRTQREKMACTSPHKPRGVRSQAGTIFSARDRNALRLTWEKGTENRTLCDLRGERLRIWIPVLGYGVHGVCEATYPIGRPEMGQRSSGRGWWVSHHRSSPADCWTVLIENRVDLLVKQLSVFAFTGTSLVRGLQTVPSFEEEPTNRKERGRIQELRRVVPYQVH